MASTLVATPSGERPIGSLKDGDKVVAYNSTTGQSEMEPIQAVWVNHDHDLVDVGLRDAASSTGTTTAASSSATTPPAAPAPSTRLHRWLPPTLAHLVTGIAATVAIAVTLVTAVPAHAATATVAATTPSAAHDETIHTTANHPWLTADRGWVEAGELQPGEAVVTLVGGTTATATVAWVQAVAGQADMYNLTVASDHTYAVGAGHAVVHNECGDLIGTAEEAATNAERRSATSVQVEDAEGNPITLPKTTFTSETAVDEGPFQDIIQQERANGVLHAGGCGERFACGALYEHADEVNGGYVEMGLWHYNGEGPCPACQRILQRTADELSITIHLEADGQPDPFIYEPDW